MGKNLPSDTGDAGLIPGWGTKMSCVLGKLSLHIPTRESTCYNKDAAQPKEKESPGHDEHEKTQKLSQVKGA